MTLRHIVILLMLLAVFASNSWGQSKEPSPSARESAQPQQQKPATDNKAAQPDQKKAEPPPIMVNVVPTPKPDHETDEERQERKEKAELDRRLVSLTGDLAFFTAGLFAATAALVIATIALAYYAFKQSRDMKESLSFAKASADATVAIAASDRPWMAQAGLDYMGAENLNIGGVAHTGGQVFQLRWLNWGKSPAVRLSLYCTFLVQGEVDPVPVFEIPDKPDVDQPKSPDCAMPAE